MTLLTIALPERVEEQLRGRAEQWNGEFFGLFYLIPKRSSSEALCCKPIIH